MRVLLISWEYPPHVIGGIGTHVARLVPLMSGLQCAGEPLYIDVLTSRYAGGAAVEAVDPFVTVYRCDLQPMDALDLYNSVVANNSSFSATAQTVAHSQRYDLIHVHDWLTAESGIRLKYAWKAPLVVTIHATERGRHQGNLPSYTSQQIDQLERKVCHEAWRVIVCSQYMRSELNHFFGTPRDKVSIIPNGIDTHNKAACTSDDLERLRQRYAPNGERLLFFIGRIAYEKGLHVLMRALPSILAAYPNTRLLVAGKNGQAMYPLAAELKVERAVEFLDYITDEERDCLYQIVDAAVFPSLYEPFGIVALEAMANHCNVIASNVGGLGEVVQHDVNGIASYPNDSMSISWAVDHLFRDPEAAAARCATAFDQVHTQYQWTDIAQQTVQLYADVYNARHHVTW